MNEASLGSVESNVQAAGAKVWEIYPDDIANDPDHNGEAAGIAFNQAVGAQ
jgi:hypothetical protein